MNEKKPAKAKGPEKPDLIRVSAWLFAVYAAIELIDCMTLGLMALGLVENLYPEMAFAEVNKLFNTNPMGLMGFFLYFTGMRIISAIGLFKDRLWGFWVAVTTLITTILAAILVLPLGGWEMLIDGAILVLLLIGYFGKHTLRNE